MPTYEYRARDEAGAPRSGQIEAPDGGRAVRMLQARGLQAAQVRQIASAQPQVVVAAPSVRSALPAPPAVGTKEVPEGRLQLYFASMANLVRAGIAVSAVFERLAANTSDRRLARASAWMARSTAEGGTISGAMRNFPTLFAPGMVGAVAAGELSGSLPQALEELSEDCRRAFWFRIPRWITWVSLWNFALCLLVGVSLRGVVLQGIDVLADSSSVTPVNQPLREPWFWLILGAMGLMLFWGWAIRRAFTRRLRHRVELMTWIRSKMARAESLRAFSRHLERMLEAGIAPAKAWSAAAEAVPNVILSERLASLNPRENEGLADVAARSDLIAPEWRGLIHTAEYAGRPSQALGAMAQAQAEDAERQRGVYWALRLTGASMLLLAGTLGGFAVIYGTYLTNVFKIVE
ncbi:MAG: type II secretion system F family protein [Fimbriimonadaceae bacterium]|nr:type II secretion system F family protein [Fimbriimonadaceae bacterium]